LKKAIENVITILIIILFMWIILSIIDTNVHNAGGMADYEYAKWNCFNWR
jgi:hypothetical protein